MSLISRHALCLAIAGVAIASGCSRSNLDSQPANSVSTPVVTHPHTNRLAREKSPYLLQHQHNPVDWYPWGSEAFEKARKDNKPIFLSIGYSTCHWCHVMERESFENEDLAKFLNAHFVSIKVDREERPDVDKIYMTAVQAMTGQGGWPLNCFLTPDRKPFYGGTYFPPEAKYGRPSFLQLLKHIAQLWETKNTELLSDAAKFHEQLENFGTQPSSPSEVLSPGVITNSLAKFKDEYEPRFGGFGNAPKFPRPSLPAFVLRQGVRFDDQEAVKMVLHTCDRMAAGGMYDQLGGGFSRYSVDAQWLVPHFEKMLYDNAQLVHLYLDAYLVSGEKRHADVARDILRYILRDMTHPGGGFYSAEDADSEGHEGKFYCWTKAELSKLLTVEEFNVTVKYFGISDEGNFEDHSHPTPLKKQNVLSIVNPDMPAADQPLLASARKKMFDFRAKRIRPHLDDKILASWNGMMLGAIARAYAVLGDDIYRTAAEKNLAFLQAKLWDANTKTLYNRWRDGERDSVQLLEAYANLIAGTVDLYEATLNSKQLEFALALTETMIAKFYDPAEGGFFQSPTGSADLIIRVKEDYDGAEPSGNSIAILALLKLSAITDRKDLREISDRSLQHFAVRMMQAPQAVPQMLLALDFAMDEPKRAVIVGHLADAKTHELLRTIHSTYQPNKVVLGQDGPVEAFAKEMPMGKSPMLYLCTGKACQPPTNDEVKIKKLLKAL
ncbi:MAG: thioredoxin domain-containing protein [Opitutaceae bacterium]|nr:thioredoxin domain-containing protein [Verrucomicrobiales bacterium]